MAADLAACSTDTARPLLASPLPAGPSRDRDASATRAPAVCCTASARWRCASRPARRSTPPAPSLRGQGSIRFSGRLRTLGAALPPGGKIVDLQASQRGRWSTVATTRTRGASGAWSAVARFRGTPGRYPVRLRIRREALFPYELGYSASVVVRVR